MMQGRRGKLGLKRQRQTSRPRERERERRDKERERGKDDELRRDERDTATDEHTGTHIHPNIF